MTQRIAAIDRIFQRHERTYIHMAETASADHRIVETRYDTVRCYTLLPYLSVHQALLASLIRKARFIYVHSIYQARFILDHFGSGARIITDMHGIVPEEEAMLGGDRSPAFYEMVERDVVTKSAAIVVVSDVMKRHFMKKYGSDCARAIVLPIVDTGLALEKERKRSGRPSVIYAGTAHRWQNVDAMFHAVKAAGDRYEFTFLTPHIAEFENAMKSAGVPAGKVTLRSVNRSRIMEYYRNSDLGFILRDDNQVNRVACPTKMFEYLAAGIIPIVMSPAIGDYQKMGYRFITLDELIKGDIPSSGRQEEMRGVNMRIARAMTERFSHGLKILASFAFQGKKSIVAAPILPYHLSYPFPEASIAVIEKNGMKRTFRKQIDLSEHTISVTITPSIAGGHIRFFPLNNSAVIRLRQVDAIDEHGRAHSCSGRMRKGIDGSISFRQGDALTFRMPSRVAVRELRIDLDYLLVGHEINHARAFPLFTHSMQTLRHVLKKSRFVVSIYRNYIVPVLRRGK